MCMDEYKNYSNAEVREIAGLARAKGLTLLEGNYNGCSAYPDLGDDSCRGFCVAKAIAGQYLTLRNDGIVCQLYAHNGPSMSRTVWFDLVLAQAKELIVNFDGTIKNPPNFFAYVRVYNDEPRYYGYLQMLHLEDFACKHGITYKERFVCIGGQENTVWHPEDGRGIDDILECCEESFSKMDQDSYLVVSDLSRLNDSIDIWRSAFDVIPVDFYEMGYTVYEYHESETLREAMRCEEKAVEDRKYEEMCQEHRKIMLELDEPFIESEEEQYA